MLYVHVVLYCVTVPTLEFDYLYEYDRMTFTGTVDTPMVTCSMPVLHVAHLPHNDPPQKTKKAGPQASHQVNSAMSK